MAVQNYFTNYAPDLSPLGVPISSALKQTGVREAYAQADVSILSSDNNGSTYILFKNILAETIISELKLECSVLTGGTSYSIGIYDSQTGAAIAANALMNAQTLAVAAGKNAPIDGLGVLTFANTMKCIYELAGHTLANKKGTYDIVLIANTASSANGNVSARARFIPPC